MILPSFTFSRVLGRSEDSAFIDQDLEAHGEVYAQAGLNALRSRFPGLEGRLSQTYELADGDTWTPADDPVVLYALARFGRLQSGEKAVPASSPVGDQWDASGAQEQIDALNEQIPPGHPRYTMPAHQRKLQALYQRAYAGSPIVGQGGRLV